MIKLIEDNFEKLKEFCSNDPFGVRIYVLSELYGNNYSFALFWMQTVDEKMTAAISKINDVITVCCNEKADFCEIKEFVNAVGYRNILCSNSYIEKLEMIPDNVGIVVKNETVLPLEIPKNYLLNDLPDYSDVFRLLTASGFSELGNYHEWLSDIAARVNKGYSEIYSLYDENKIAASASLLFKSKHIIFLGAIATDSEYRGKGLAGCLISHIIKIFPDKDCFLFCKKELLGFYEKLGFIKTDEWASIMK